MADCGCGEMLDTACDRYWEHAREELRAVLEQAIDVEIARQQAEEAADDAAEEERILYGSPGTASVLRGVIRA